MQVNTNNLISITEANQNFSRVAKLVDENGTAVILKNNVPRYVIMEIEQFQKIELSDDENVGNIAKRLLSTHMHAFEALAK